MQLADGVRKMLKYHDLTLDQWIAEGRATGAIKNKLTVIWAHRAGEADALQQIAAIVCGYTSEHDMLARVQWNQRAQHPPARINWFSCRYKASQRLH